MQGVPSARTADFYASAMAHAGLNARLVILNRGQGEAMELLCDLLPLVDGATLQRDLMRMLQAHGACCDRLLQWKRR
ncbi:hypothetical protein D3C78_1679390 [compost metagenome]